jgi:Zn-dependent protease
MLVHSVGVPALLSWIFWVVASIVLHELAHGWAAIWQGDDTPVRLHRMTANPLVHMGPWSLLIFALIGIAWGVMPVDPSRFRWGRRGRIVVSGAGPAMNICLAVLCLTLMVVWLKFGPEGHRLYENLRVFFWTGGMLNVVLALLNLLPVPPLDGSDVLAGLSFRAWRLFRSPQAPMFGMFILLAIFITPLSMVFWGGGELIAAAWAGVVGRLIDAPVHVGLFPPP